MHLLLLLACSSSASSPDKVPEEPPAASTEEAPSASSSTVPTPSAVERRPAADPDNHAVVVAIHGLGDHPSRFIAMAEGLSDVATVIAPGGWEPRGQGFSWFAIRAREGGPGLADAVARSADQLAAWLGSQGVDADDDVVVTGFSQGGMLSFALAVRHPTLVDAAVPLGGLLPEALWPTAVPPDAPPILALHGGADEVVPTQAARDSVAALQAAGWPADIMVWEGEGHRVPTSMRVVMDTAVRAALNGQDPLVAAGAR
ncbi:MAG: alpha/beta fold hydrolase [Alphaproteobacteria bacterium]|nr:alpha/beta fold hydrolase [Alphaproteobacteria bacterium]